MVKIKFVDGTEKEVSPVLLNNLVYQLTGSKDDYIQDGDTLTFGDGTLVLADEAGTEITESSLLEE